MTITLKPSTEAMLVEKARQEGQDLDTVADTLLADLLKAELREQEETAEAVRAAMNSRPGKPIEQYLAEQRAKHGYPETWPRQGIVNEITPGVFVDSE